jgi:hypothetical protein
MMTFWRGCQLGKGCGGVFEVLLTGCRSLGVPLVVSFLVGL